MNKFLAKLKTTLISNLAYFLLTIINKSLRLEVVGADHLELISEQTPLLFAAWHGKTWIPVYYLRDRNYLALASLSQDGEYMARLLTKLGWQVIRGSSSRGASRSLLKLYRQLKEGNSTAITPDGPTGPIYNVKPGIIYLQQRSGGYLVPLGSAAEQKKNFASWDKYMLPFPFSKAVLVIGKPIKFQEGSLTMEEKAKILAEAINAAERKAENILAQEKEV